MYILQHVILSAGGSYVIQDELDDMADKERAKIWKKVTHVVMDRPIPASS